VNPDPVLARHWRRKLRASGFHDIELPDGNLRPAEKPPGRWRSFDKAHKVEREAVAEYFHRATVFTASHAFRGLTKTQRAAWRLHAQGFSNSEVASALNTTLKKVRNAIRSGRILSGLPETTSFLGHGKR
jgi:DNA-directed RNA polymerase specialized sigma24 family protein